jgi:hypothetical protein
VVASDDFGKSRPYPALGNHPNALDKLSALPYPRPSENLANTEVQRIALRAIR